MICVTAAGGTVSREVIQQLRSARVPFRAAHFSSERADAARAQGLDVVTIDYRNPQTFDAAFRGCSALFLLGPNLPDQTELELGAVEAARAAGVRRVVKLSVLGAEDAGFKLGRVHRPVELALESSGLGWTFLRSNGFMQNVVTFMRSSIVAESAFYSASGQAKISHIDVRDLACVAVKALMAPAHTGRVYTLTGPEALSYDELADELSVAVGRPIRHVDLPPAELKQGMLAEGLPPVIAERLLDLERYYREGRASLTSDDLARVNGTPGRSFRESARDFASLLRSAA